MTALSIVDLGLAAMIVAIALFAVHVRGALAAVVGFTAFGLLLALAWVRLRAVDIALTEAAVGTGVTGMLLFRAAVGLEREVPSAVAPARPVRLVAALLSTAVAAALAALVLYYPPESHTLAPAAAQNLARTGMGNPVTAVLIAYRGLDTLLEKVVLVAALVGVWSLSDDRAWGGPPGAAAAVPAPGAAVLFATVLAPLSVIMGVYMFWVGADAPGGVFQGGAVMAAAWILLMMTGLRAPPPVLSRRLRVALVIGPAVFIVAGFAGIPLAGSFLAFPAGFAKPVILIIEAALMISITATLGMIVLGPPRKALP